MKILPIIGNNQLFGHYGSWYRAMFVKYLYNQGQGELIMGQIEGLLATGGTVGIIILLVDRYTGHLFPWQWAIILGIAIKIFKVYLGHLDKTKLKIGQAMSNYGIEANTQPKPAELLNRVKNIEAKVSPETADKKYETYFEKEANL